MDLSRLRYLYKLKEVERACSVKGRRESTPEHVWSTLMLADYFLSRNDYGLNRSRVMDLILYHDLIEIETGDIDLIKEEERKSQRDRERKMAPVLAEKLPAELKEKFLSLFKEFDEQKTREARFVKAVEYLDAEIHELDYKEDWKGWTEEFLRSKKEHLVAEFPQVAEVFEASTAFARENGFFDQ